jgi:hypothetical protein
VLGNLLGLSGFDYENSESIRDEALGKGNTDLSAKLNNVAKLGLSAGSYAPAGQLERVADVPIYFTDALSRRSEPLQRTADANAPLVSLPLALADKLGVKAGDKVKVTIMVRGREQSRPELGFRLLQRLASDVADLGVIESAPKQDGRNMIMVLAPHKQARTRQTPVAAQQQ